MRSKFKFITSKHKIKSFVSFKLNNNLCIDVYVTYYDINNNYTTPFTVDFYYVLSFKFR